MNRMSSIELALKNEATEMDFYLEQATLATNKVTQALFFELAKDERDHMERIQALHSKLVSDGSWPVDVTLDVAGTNVKDVLEEVARDTSLQATPDAGEVEALKKGISFEQAGAVFYERLAKMCENPQEIAFFTFLAGIENEHLMSMRDTLTYLEDPQTWLDEKGRSGLDGA